MSGCKREPNSPRPSKRRKCMSAARVDGASTRQGTETASGVSRRAGTQRYWVIAKVAKDGLGQLELLTLDLEGTGEALPVFSFEEEAEMFLWLQRNISASSSKLKTGSASPVPSRSSVSSSSWPNPSFATFAITQYRCVPARRDTPLAVSVPCRVETPSTRAALMHFLRFEGRGLFGSRLQPDID